MQRDISIIGLSGTNGAGKDTVGELLAERHGYLFISVTELLRDECKRRGLPVEREHLREISAEWRRAQGYAVLVDKAMEQYRASGSTYAGVVMSSLRNPYEADRIHELGGILVWVDADPAIRFKRVTAGRGRGAEDNKTLEQFMAEEQAEMYKPAGGDEASLDMASVKERADILLENNVDSLDELDKTARQTLGL